MPIEWFLQVLEARVAQWSDSANFSVIDLDSLGYDDAGALMREVYSAGEDFPVVLVDGAIACVSGIDLDAVRAALAAAESRAASRS